MALIFSTRKMTQRPHTRGEKKKAELSILCTKFPLQEEEVREMPYPLPTHSSAPGDKLHL